MGREKDACGRTHDQPLGDQATKRRLVLVIDNGSTYIYLSMHMCEHYTIYMHNIYIYTHTFVHDKAGIGHSCKTQVVPIRQLSGDH